MPPVSIRPGARPIILAGRLAADVQRHEAALPK